MEFDDQSVRQDILDLFLLALGLIYVVFSASVSIYYMVLGAKQTFKLGELVDKEIEYMHVDKKEVEQKILLDRFDKVNIKANDSTFNELMEMEQSQEQEAKVKQKVALK